MFESMMKWAAGLTAVGCVLVMAAAAGADFEYSATRTEGAELFPGVCTRVVVANDGTWLMLRRCHADGSGPGATDHTGQVFWPAAMTEKRGPITGPMAAGSALSEKTAIIGIH